MTVILAVSYGGREEIARAARAIARRVRRGELEPEQHHGRHGREAPRHERASRIPDLLIRTSGEMRLSNFFLWQLAYTEIYVTETLWPDFREREFLQALGVLPAAPAPLRADRRAGRARAALPGRDELSRVGRGASRVSAGMLRTRLARPPRDRHSGALADRRLPAAGVVRGLHHRRSAAVGAVRVLRDGAARSPARAGRRHRSGASSSRRASRRRGPSSGAPALALAVDRRASSFPLVRPRRPRRRRAAARAPAPRRPLCRLLHAALRAPARRERRRAGAGCCSRCSRPWGRTPAATSPGGCSAGTSSRPTVSPSKTVRARIGAVAGAMLIAGSAAHARSSPASARAKRSSSARSISVLAQFGDLCESALKRAFGAKDSGWIIPGHGGILDRLDSLLFPVRVRVLLRGAAAGLRRVPMNISSLAFTLLSFAVALGVLVFVHELGHFLVAKRLGVKVLRFSIGFGPVHLLAGARRDRVRALGHPAGRLREDARRGRRRRPRRAAEPERAFSTQPVAAARRDRLRRARR